MKFLVSLILFAVNVFAEVSSVGFGEVAVEPTEAEVIITIREVAREASSASKASSKKANEIVTWLKSSGVKEVKTVSVNLSPQFNYDAGKQTQVGFESVYSVLVSTSLDRVGEIIDGALSKGANGISGLNFTASKDVLAKAKNQAIKAATENALVQIDAALSGAGKSRGEVSSIKVLSEGIPSPRPMMKVAEMSVGSAPIEGGSLVISASVEVTTGF